MSRPTRSLSSLALLLLALPLGATVACGKASSPSQAPASAAAGDDRAEPSPEVTSESEAKEEAAEGGAFAQPPPPAAPAEDRDGEALSEKRRAKRKGAAREEDELLQLSTLPEAEKALKKYATRLAGLELAGRAAPGAQQGTPRPKPKPSRRPAAPGGGAGDAAPVDDGGTCAIACKAFSSLRRAADAVCRLAGDDSEKCAEAKKLVKENAERVESCGCE